MKAVNSEPEEFSAPDEDSHWMRSGRQLEQAGANEKAIALYKSMLKRFPHQAYIYDRLMILYRKQKEYKKELSILNTAIKEFTGLMQPATKSRSPKVATLSKSILRAVGLSDKKGKSLYLPEPIARWEKRRKTVKRKLEG